MESHVVTALIFFAVGVLATLVVQQCLFLSRPIKDKASERVPSPPAVLPREQPERLDLKGRIGSRPKSHIDRNGSLAITLPLAVMNKDNSTTWHTILVFGEQAEELHEQLYTGVAVRVTGHQHERQVRTKGGEIKTVQEVHATTVELL